MTEYMFNKIFTLKELKDKGFEITYTDEHKYPFAIEKYGSIVLVLDDYIEGKRPKCDDDFAIDEIHGADLGGGLDIVVDICNKLDLKFYTDDAYIVVANTDKEINDDFVEKFEEEYLSIYHYKRNEEGLIVRDDADEDNADEDSPLPPTVEYAGNPLKGSRWEGLSFEDYCNMTKEERLEFKEYLDNLIDVSPGFGFVDKDGIYDEWMHIVNLTSDKLKNYIIERKILPF